MTEPDINKLKSLLTTALINPNEVNWRNEARLLLGIESSTKLSTGHKWEGEVCKTCGHSSNVHSGADHKGFCFAANCSCDCFVSSGRQVNE